MRTYRCYYLMKGDEPSPLAPFVQLFAANAASAAQLARHITGCACVTDVQRVQD